MALTQDQLARRRLGIGASEAAAAIGISRYATPVDVYLSKVMPDSGRDLSGTMADFGNSLESAIIDYYERRTGVHGYRWPDTLVSKHYPWMFAHLDFLAGDRVVDAKLHGGQDYGEPGTDQVPQEVLCQLHHQMIVAEVDFAQVAAFVLTQRGPGRTVIEFRTYDVPYNAALGEAIIEGERLLWESVLTRTPPEASSVADRIKLWTRADPSLSAVATGATHEAWKELLTVRDASKQLEAHRESLENILKDAMREAATLVDADGNVLATWKQDNDSSRLDGKMVEEKYPDVWDECQKNIRGARKFIIKTPKEK